MEIKELKCKNCGASINAKETDGTVTCKYCNTTYSIESDEQNGYEFEKGRMKAQEEKAKENMENFQKGFGGAVFNMVKFGFIFNAILTVVFFIVFIAVVGFIISGIIHSGF